MLTQVPALVSSTSTEKTVRRTADFHPSLWGNHFLTCSSDFKTINATTEEEYEALKQEVRRMITATAHKPAQKLQLVDAVQRLGVAYHFEEEIEEALEKIYHDLDDDTNDLCVVSLCFRLLRQQGFNISCDVFEKFTDDEGKFRASLINEVEGMLSLYEAAQLAIRGEDILDEAIEFSTTQLKLMVTHVSPTLAEQINRALRCPLRRAIPRLEARFFMDIYSTDDLQDKTLLKFAKLDFNVVQAIHQKELSDITQWWKDLDFTSKLPYIRDRLVELYFWIMGVYFEPKYSYGRSIMAKVICITSIIDDTFDAYGTLEELKLFTEAVERWDLGAIDILPEYMKFLYERLLDIFREIEEHTAKKGRQYCIHYAEKAMQELVQAYIQEVIWFNQGYVPKMEEYIPVGIATTAQLMFVTIFFIGVADIHTATEEAFAWLSNYPKSLRGSAIVSRLMNDIASHKVEQKRGHVASAVECYMKQHGVSEEDAVEVLRQETANAWKDINEDFLKPTAVSLPFLERILNITRVADFTYKDDIDAYTNSYLMKDSVASLVVDPVIL